MGGDYSLSVFDRVYSYSECTNIEVGYWTTCKFISNYSLCSKLYCWCFFFNNCEFLIENSFVLLLSLHSSTDTPKHHLNWGMCCNLTPTPHCSPFNKHPCAWQNLIAWGSLLLNHWHFTVRSQSHRYSLIQSNICCPVAWMHGQNNLINIKINIKY